MSFIVKNTTFPGLMDLVAPHSCRGCGRIGSVICGCCKKYININKIGIFSPPGEQDYFKIYAVGWRTGLVEDLIYSLKYNSTRALAKPLAELMDDVLPAKLGKDVRVVPLPTTSRHIRERGLDHTMLIAKHLVKLRNKWMLSKILVRQKNTVQVGANKETRLKQANEAYKLTGAINKDATYVLVDDVWTTGASMRAAAKKLRRAGVSKIVAVVLAVGRLD